MNTRRYALVVLITVCAGLTAFLLLRPDRTVDHVKPRPNTASTEVQATPVTIFLKTHGLLGHVTLVQFGAVGCEVSEEGLDQVSRWQSSAEIPGLRYARVELSGDAAQVDAYYAGRSVGFPVIRDPVSAAARLFEATAIPTFVLTDSFGRIRYRGSLPSEHIQTWVQVLLSENNDPGTHALLFGAEELNIPGLLVDTSLRALDGTSARPLLDRLDDAGLMVVFVDTKCPYAAQVMKEMPDIAPPLAKLKIATVLINVTDAKSVIDPFYKKRQVGAPVIYDEGASTHLKWNIYSVPNVFVINSERKLIYGGVALWTNVADAVAQDLGLSPGSLAFQHRGTEYG